jgi:hypothetical protein
VGCWPHACSLLVFTLFLLSTALSVVQRELEKGEGPIALVLTPTRELAMQVFLPSPPPVNFNPVLALPDCERRSALWPCLQSQHGWRVWWRWEMGAAQGSEGWGGGEGDILGQHPNYNLRYTMPSCLVLFGGMAGIKPVFLPTHLNPNHKGGCWYAWPPHGTHEHGGLPLNPHHLSCA